MSDFKQERYGNNIVIKRYQNRKLYDCNQSCYVTLDELYDIFRVYGHAVKVINNKTKTDITARIMRQVLIEKGNRKAFLDEELMLDKIQRGEHL